MIHLFHFWLQHIYQHQIQLLWDPRLNFRFFKHQPRILKYLQQILRKNYVFYFSKYKITLLILFCIISIDIESQLWRKDRDILVETSLISPTMQ